MVQICVMDDDPAHVDQILDILLPLLHAQPGYATAAEAAAS